MEVIECKDINNKVFLQGKWWIEECFDTIIEIFKLKMENEANGEWKVENGKWRMESGEWKVENGKWRMENESNGISLLAWEGTQ